MEDQTVYDKNLKELFNEVLEGTEVDSTMKKQVFDAIDFIKFMGDMTMHFSDTFTDAQVNMLDTLNPTKEEPKSDDHE